MKKALIAIVVIIHLIGCNNKSSMDLKSKTDVSKDSNQIRSLHNQKTAFPMDTLDFLNYEVLMDFQNHERLVIPEILKYALSPEIRIIRNEMYARKGYIFKDDFLQQYFSHKKWYYPNVSSIDSIKFSIHEKSLLDSLIVYEKRNSNLTIDTFRDELKKILLIPNYSKKIPITLWKHVLGEYPRSTNLVVAPWDFLGNSYTVIHSDSTLGFYHCIISFYSGAEGSNCISQTIYILNKNLNLIHQTDLNTEYSDIKQINKGLYSFKTMVEKDNDNWVEITGTYRILETGEIEIKNNR